MHSMQWHLGLMCFRARQDSGKAFLVLLGYDSVVRFGYQLLGPIFQSYVREASAVLRVSYIVHEDERLTAQR